MFSFTFFFIYIYIYKFEFINGFIGEIALNDTSITSIESYYNSINKYYINKTY